MYERKPVEQDFPTKAFAEAEEALNHYGIELSETSDMADTHNGAKLAMIIPKYMGKHPGKGVDESLTALHALHAVPHDVRLYFNPDCSIGFSLTDAVGGNPWDTEAKPPKLLKIQSAAVRGDMADQSPAEQKLADIKATLTALAFSQGIVKRFDMPLSEENIMYSDDEEPVGIRISPTPDGPQHVIIFTPVIAVNGIPSETVHGTVEIRQLIATN